MYESSIQAFASSLLFLQMEYMLFLSSKPNDKPSYIFDNMNFHPIVKNSSEKLFKDKHYAQAIFEACKALIQHVKDKSGIVAAKDRDMMGQVFGIQYTTNPLKVTKYPVLQLNSLRSLEEIDEQEGFMHIFLGVLVGVRNPKAHANAAQKDSYKTLEYLSLISLLAKRTDEANFAQLSS